MTTSTHAWYIGVPLHDVAPGFRFPDEPNTLAPAIQFFNRDLWNEESMNETKALVLKADIDAQFPMHETLDYADVVFDALRKKTIYGSETSILRFKEELTLLLRYVFSTENKQNLLNKLCKESDLKAIIIPTVYAQYIQTVDEDTFSAYKHESKTERMHRFVIHAHLFHLLVSDPSVDIFQNGEYIQTACQFGYTESVITLLTRSRDESQNFDEGVIEISLYHAFKCGHANICLLLLNDERFDIDMSAGIVSDILIHPKAYADFSSIPASIYQAIEDIEEVIFLGLSTTTPKPTWLSNIPNNNSNIILKWCTGIPDWIEDFECSSYSFTHTKFAELPEWIYSSLVNLSIDHNGALTEFPVQVCDCENLRMLSITNTNITYIPESIAKLKNVSNFFFSDNKIATLPQSLELLHPVHGGDMEIDLSNNNITLLPKWNFQTEKEIRLILSDNSIEHIPVSLLKPNILLHLRGNPSLVALFQAITDDKIVWKPYTSQREMLLEKFYGHQRIPL